MKRIHYPLLLVVLVSQSGLAAAADDMTQNIGDLQKALQAQDIRLGRLESQLQNKGLLNLLNEVEALKAEVARLRGTQEELAYQQSNADKRAKDLFADLDDRVKELESRPVEVASPPNAIHLQPAQALSTPVAAAVAPPVAALEGETKAYEAAHNLVKAGRYKEAVLALQTFAKTYPNSSLVPNAHYWTGFSYVGMSDFESAAASYQYLIQTFPHSPKTADAMLSLARAQVQMNRQTDAITTLESLIAKFPYSRAADNGKKLLSTLK
jgi:tol-pal system protein YbgF